MASFAKLKETAIARQQQEYDAATGKFVASKRKLGAKESELSAVDSFMCAGIDYKGQSQCAYQMNGGGLEGNASFDPGRIFGVLSCEVGVTAGATRSDKVLIIAQRGPSQIESSAGILEIDYPIMLNCLRGARWEGVAKVDLFVGVSAKFSVGTGEDAATETSWGPEAEEADEVDEVDEGMGFETASLGFEAEAKAGFASEASYTYENFYAEDLCPLPFDSKVETREALGVILDAGDAQTVVKKSACDFINKNPAWFEAVRYQGRVWGTISPGDVSKVLSAGLAKSAKSGISKKAKRQAKAFVSFLSSHPSIPTSIRVSTHTGAGSAGLVAEAGVSASASTGKVLGAGASASASAKVSADALKIEGSYKSANVRYQAAYPAPHEALVNSYVIMTQDSKITYKQIEFSPLTVKAEASVSAGASLGALGGDIGREYSEEGEVEKEVFEKQTLLNRMTYTTSTVFWHSSDTASLTARTLPGTGVSFGGSFELDNLLKFYQDYTYDSSSINPFYSPSIQKYFTVVAASLNVGLDDLIKFFTEMPNGLLYDLKMANGVEVVLLEAGFAVDATPITLKKTVSGKNTLIELASDTAGKILNLKPKKVQSIRARFRIQDTSNDDSDGFSLGFKFFGTGIGIKLKNVEQAGSEGIVDLATVWIDKSLDSEFDPASSYERGVPQVALLCQ